MTPDRPSAPASERASRRPSVLPPPALVALPPARHRLTSAMQQMGEVSELTWQVLRSALRRPLEIPAMVYQMDSLGIRSLMIVAVTSIFIGMVMTIQFAWGLKRFGGVEYIPRVIVLSFVRELGPTLTAVIVGGRIGSGMAAEVGAMNVTEQVDAIRALGADPAKKLVLPRVVAAMIVMPVLSAVADTLGTLGAIIICATQFDISPQLFVRSALDSLVISDFLAGLAKTPVFGYIIAIVGCHFGLRTTGGTEGVGTSTTRSVVAISIAILISDFLMTKLFMSIGFSQ